MDNIAKQEVIQYLRKNGLAHKVIYADMVVTLGNHVPSYATIKRWVAIFTLWKHTYSNIMKISPTKTENFQTKNSDIFHISAQNSARQFLRVPTIYVFEQNKKNNENPFLLHKSVA